MTELSDKEKVGVNARGLAFEKMISEIDSIKDLCWQTAKDIILFVYLYRVR